MKRKLIICSSLITLLLACFSFPIYAEENIEDIEELSEVDLPDYALDQYFYDNYNLLPYIESNADDLQWIDTGIKASNNLDVYIAFSDLDTSHNSGIAGITNNNRLYFGVFYRLNLVNFSYGYASNNFEFSNIVTYPYQMIYFRNVGNTFYFNNLSNTVTDSEFTSNYNIPIFCNINDTNGQRNAYASMKLYRFNIYDRSLNNGEGGYVRYYYPAKSKSSGIIGLYDSVSKTFVTTGGSVPFASPINDQVISFQISSFLTASLTWIGQIFDAIIQMPIIIVFMAIGLAGVMFRWGRRIVHF